MWIAASIGLAVLAAVLFGVWTVLKPPAALPDGTFKLHLKRMPAIAYVYRLTLRSVITKDKVYEPPLVRQGVEVIVTRPVAFSRRKYASYVALVGYREAPPSVPLLYPIVEAFRLCMLTMMMPGFPLNVVGSVLARNKVTVLRALSLEDKLTHRCDAASEVVQNSKGDFEVVLRSSATSVKDGVEVWLNELTVIVLNPRRQKDAHSVKQPTTAEFKHSDSIDTWELPANAGRQYGSLNGDRNPIHMFPFTSRFFGFDRPIAHALYLVGRVEASLYNQGIQPVYPAIVETEFRRPTLLPATLQCVVDLGADVLKEGIKFAVLTTDEKPVVTGSLYHPKVNSSADTSEPTVGKVEM